MRREVVRAVAVAVLCTLLLVPPAGCHSRSAAPIAAGRSSSTFSGTDPTPIHPATVTAAAVASNRFGFDVYARARSGDRNLIFSPISATFALAMAAAGAKSETLAQLSRVLHVDTLANAHEAFADLLASLPDVPDIDAKTAGPSIEGVVPDAPHRAEPPVLHMADRIWTQAGFTYRDDFMSILRDRYRAPLGELDFEQAPEPARAAINAWVAKQTRGRIQDLLPPESIDHTTRLVLTNAVYFKGSWLLQFVPGLTLEKDFATAKAKVHAKMMRQLSHFGYARLDGVALVELPYFGSSISMVVILPDAESGLADVENRIGRDYDGWMTALVDKKVDLWLPRWKDTRTIVLDGILKALGMPLPFERTADFSGMTDMPAQDPGKFHIGTVIQKAFVDVDEFGTEAAAATAIVMAYPMSLLEGPPEPEPVVFHADHPFLYVIRERKTGAVLFVGRVVDPR